MQICPFLKQSIYDFERLTTRCIVQGRLALAISAMYICPSLKQPIYDFE